MRWKPTPPDHKIKALLSSAKEDLKKIKDPVLRSVAGILLEEEGQPDEVLYAHSIYEDTWQREVIEAFLLAAASPQDIDTVLGIPPEVTEVYSSVYFDIDAFRNRLDVESYARRYPKTRCNGFGHQIKTAAIEMGLHYLSALYGRGTHAVPPDKILEDLIAQNFVMSKIPMTATPGSIEAKEARQWGASLLSSMRALPEIREGMSGNTNDLRMRLMTVTKKNDTNHIDKDDVIIAVLGDD